MDDDVEDHLAVRRVVGIDGVEDVAGIDRAPDDVLRPAFARQQADARLRAMVPAIGEKCPAIAASIENVTGRSRIIAKRCVIAQSWIIGPCSTGIFDLAARLPSGVTTT